MSRRRGHYVLCRWACCALVGILDIVGTAQTRPARTEPEPPSSFGSVAGRVFLAESQGPARFASVALQPLEVKDPPKSTSGAMTPVPFTIYQTDLNGSFRIDHVRPGLYYVVVNSPGSLSPFALFSKEELMHPDAEVAKRIAGAVPAVQVTPSAVATINLQLHRGANLAGTVRFDDGTVFPGAWVNLERHDKDGKWTSPRATESSTTTDLEGRWQIAGLPAGEYRVQLDLQVQDRHQSAVLGDSGSSWSSTKSTMPVYLGDTVRKSKARLIKLDDGEQSTGLEITVPVSRMHTVSGTLVDAKTGSSLNAGTVALVYPDDSTEITSVKVDPESQTFELPFVLEGTYTLQTRDAREVRLEQTGDPENDPFHQNRKEVVLRQYGPGEMPLVVQGEMSGVTLGVDVKAVTTQ